MLWGVMMWSMRAEWLCASGPFSRLMQSVVASCGRSTFCPLATTWAVSPPSPHSSLLVCTSPSPQQHAFLQTALAHRPFVYEDFLEVVIDNFPPRPSCSLFIRTTTGDIDMVLHGV